MSCALTGHRCEHEPLPGWDRRGVQDGVLCSLQLQDRDKARVGVPLRHRRGGYAQIATFMREMADGEEFLEDNGITPENLGPLIAAKIRRQSILHEGGRPIVHIIGEAVLRTRVGNVTVETMRDQLAHLADTATLPGHELGIVPFSIASPVAPASGVRALRR